MEECSSECVILAMQNNLTVTTLKMLGDISKTFLKSHDVAISEQTSTVHDDLKMSFGAMRLHVQCSLILTISSVVKR